MKSRFLSVVLKIYTQPTYQTSLATVSNKSKLLFPPVSQHTMLFSLYPFLDNISLILFFFFKTIIYPEFLNT